MKQSKIKLQATLCSLLAMGTLLLGSCGVTRPSYESPNIEAGSSRADILTSIERSSGAWRALRATQQASIKFGSRELNSRMSMHCVRGEGIRLVLTPFPLVEAVRAWVTRDGITVVDVLGGRYAQEDYAAISARLGIELSYEQIEALLLGRMFTHRGADAAALRALDFTPQTNGGSLWSSKLSSRYTYTFDLDARGLLEEAKLSRANQDVLRVLYQGHFALDTSGAMAPQQMTFILPETGLSSSRRAELEIEWTRASIVEPTELSIEPSIKPSYTRISIDQVLKMIKSK